MGRKQHWSKMWWESVLADDNLKQLSLSAKGLWFIMIAVAQTQMDRPGVFVKNERVLTLDDIHDTCMRHTGSSHGQHMIRTRSSLDRMHDLGMIRQIDGIYFIQRIVDDVAESERMAILGKKRQGSPGHRAGHRLGDTEEEERRRRRSAGNGKPEQSTRSQYRAPTPIRDIPDDPDYKPIPIPNPNADSESENG